MYQGILKISMHNSKTGVKLAKTSVKLSQALRQGSELKVKGFRLPLLDARDPSVELGHLYVMVKNQGVFVHPEQIRKA